MKLRQYQEEFVNSSIKCLKEHDGVLGVAATGAGKTVCLSAVASHYRRVLVLQHTTELLEQNSKTFGWVAPERVIGVIDSDNNDVDSQVTFAMRQTIINRLDQLHAYDLIVIDEAHHSICSEYLAVIEHLRELNPDTKLFGVTATPERADKEGLSKVYDVISYKVNIDDLIRLGFLVPPTAYVIKVSELDTAETDEQVEAILNTEITHKKVIEEWRAKAANRRTIVFCQTVKHAQDVAAAFEAEGIKAAAVDGKMPARKRKRLLKSFERGDIQIMCNAQILTEGYDCQPISCVMLLRRSASKSSLIQMVGRGLRKLDPSRFPDVIKRDCVVMDFGSSLLRHGNLDAGERLSFESYDYDAEIEAALQCPACGGPIEPKDKQCPRCLHVIERDAEGRPVQHERVARDFSMTELEIFKIARFHYESLGDGKLLISHGWDAWSLVYEHKSLFYTVAARKRCQPKLLCCSPSKIEAITTADDFLSENGLHDLSGKQKAWLLEPATRNQMEILPARYQQLRISKHMASCLLVVTADGRWKRIKNKIQKHYDETGHKYHEK